MQEDDELLRPSGCDEDDHTAEVAEFEEFAESNFKFLRSNQEDNTELIHVEDSESRTSEDAMYHNEEADTTETSENLQKLSLSELSSALDEVEGQPVHCKSSEDAESCVFSEHEGMLESTSENQATQGERCIDKDNEDDECPDLVDLSTLNKKLNPYRNEGNIPHVAENKARTRTTSVSSLGSCSTIPPELVKKKIKRQLTKQQKSALRQRLQKGEANIYTKQRRENMHNIKSSLDAASFWG
uniref:Uncharacterized protein n=1 Tax=Pavo cristatus TaxID=9049 RepID=A0A8C9EVX9_PAVCR